MFFFIIKKPVKIRAASVKRVFAKAKKKKFGPIGTQGQAELGNRYAQLRLVRNATTIMLNELEIKDRVRRANIHRATQAWKKAQLNSFYTTGKTTTEGKAREAFNQIKHEFKDPIQFIAFMQGLGDLTREIKNHIIKLKK